MGGIPPSRDNPYSSSLPSQGSEGPKDAKVKRANRDFELPQKKKEKFPKDKKEKKKDDLGDIFTGMRNVESLKSQVTPEHDIGEVKGITKSAGAGSTAVGQIGKLIQKLVSEMRIGKVGEKSIVEMTLSAKTAPEVFAGSNLTLSYKENALVIHFDNFTTPQQERNALVLVEQNKKQLLSLMEVLQSKNIMVNEFSIGTHKITLPRLDKTSAQPIKGISEVSEIRETRIKPKYDEEKEDKEKK